MIYNREDTTIRTNKNTMKSYTPTNEGYQFETPIHATIEEMPAYNPHQVNINTFLDWCTDDCENTFYAKHKRFFWVSFDKYCWCIYNKQTVEERGIFAQGMDFTARKKIVQEAFTRFYKSEV